MRKSVFIAGIVFFAGLLFVQPSRADNFNHYQLTGAAFGGMTISFTLPQTLTPSSVTWNGILNFTNVAGTWGKDGQNTPYNFATVQIGSMGSMGTNYWASGGATRFVELEAPGLFTWNADGTVTLNTGTFALGDYHSFHGGPLSFTLTVVDPPGPGTDDVVGTPEPASLMLLSVGGLALGALRRRKTN
jgi:PEP-CTERM motif